MTIKEKLYTAGRKVVTVYRFREDIRILTGDEFIDGADVVPGWRLPVASIFA